MDTGKSWEALVDKWRQQGHGSLSGPEKVWFNVRALVDAITNGGLVSYYYNSGADTLPDCLIALERIGAVELKSTVERMNALFPGGVVPADLEARNSVISSWPDDGAKDAALERLDNEAMPLLDSVERRLEDYLRRNGI